MRPIRALTDAERQLWNEVARSVRPAMRRPGASATVDESPKAEQALDDQAPRQAPPKTAAVRQQARKPPEPPPLAPIERRLRQRLARGQRPIDAKIDLHGLRQAEAFAALLGFLARAQRQGAAMVLVVTGKGGRREKGDGPGSDYGILRRMVPLWLADPAVRRLVIGFEEAAPAHGGSGALYVRVRRIQH